MTKTDPDDFKRFRIVLHECGHAVIAHRLGCRVTAISAMPLDGGWTTHQPKVGASSFEAAVDDIVIALAGYEAEELYLALGDGLEIDGNASRASETAMAVYQALSPDQQAHLSAYTARAGSGRTDLEKVADATREAGGPEAPLLYAFCLQRAHRLVFENARQITGLTQIALGSAFLTGDQVESAIQELERSQ
jgi:hypothetical protein